MSSIAVIIITYNSERCITKCLESVKNNVSDKFKLFFTLIDNFSSDSSAKIINDQESEDCIVITNRINYGFAKGINQGIELAKNKFSPDYFLLLNPDATLDKNALDQLLQQSQENKNSLYSPLIVDQTSKGFWFCGAKIDWIKQKTKHQTTPQSKTRPYQTNILSGCCLLIPSDVLRQVGSFDEKFYLYYEDADYCIRANKINIRSFIVPKSICYHTESQSSTTESKCRHIVKSGLLFFNKHIPPYFKIYFWTLFYARFLYHKFISRKKCVLEGMNDFQSEKNLPKTNNSI